MKPAETIATTASYDIVEEITNAVTHGLGALLSVAALTLLLSYAIAQQDALRITSFTIYGSSLIILFLSSTMYHAIVNQKAKQMFKLLDHCAIYLLIAGTYTPLMLVTLNDSFGYSMLALIWTIAIAGIVFQLTLGLRYKTLSLLSYLGMGGMSVVTLHKLSLQLATSGLVLLAAGVLFYGLGVYFYVRKSIRFNHAIWHLFVLGGAICHFFMIWLYV